MSHLKHVWLNFILTADLCVSAALAAVKDTVKVPWDQTGQPGKPQESPVIPTPSSSEAGQSNVLLEASAEPELVTQPTASISNEPSPRAQLPKAEEPEQEASESSAEATQAKEDSAKAPEAKTGDAPANTGASESAPAFVPRTLMKKHFDVALSEIRPSSSEEGSLPELRKWAEQYGEGGSERGRKKGFGKGFGFAEAADRANRDKGYGKVAQDD